MSSKTVHTYLRSALLTLLLACVGIPSYAQAIYSLKVELTNDDKSEPVAFATVSVTVKGEKEPHKYVLTDENGHGTITKLKKGTYIFRAELMGFKTVNKEVIVDQNVDLGKISMSEDAEILDAASISAVGNPIIVKKDTIEYTASSFKTSDNDMLEELLKKLPGVEVEADGSITANGETIKKITIDGKTFFLDDPQLASKNIPAKLIEKVKVVEKKSDQAMFTGIDDGEEETIIDLSMRPGMMKGWFGNVMAGGGHDVPGQGSDMNDMRYQGAAMVGRFTDKSQISLILNGNNTNNRGFNDMAGSMMRGMRGGPGGGRGMGMGMGGWGRGNGITTSWMGGLNGAFTLVDGAMDLAGNYLYNGSVNDVIEDVKKITFNEGSRLINNQSGIGSTMTQGHRIGMRLEHKFSENTSILFEPQFHIGGGSFNESSDFETLTQYDGAADAVETNKGYTSNFGENDNWQANGFLLFRQKLGKPGRTISANIRYNFSNNLINGINQSLTSKYDDENGLWSDDVVNQRFNQKSSSASLNGRVVYTEPLGHDLFLEANYSYGWNRNFSEKFTYNSGAYKTPDSLDEKLEYNPDGEKPDEKYSNRILNRAITQRAGLNISYQKEKFRAQLGVSANPTDTYNETTGHKPYRNTVVNWSPQAMMNYEFDDNTNIRFFYFGRSSQPSTSQLLPVPDNSDPINISLGNPNLNPYFNHNLRGMFGYTNKKTFTSVHARFGASLVENPITNARWNDEGVQYSIPVNGPNSGSADLRVMVNSPFGSSGFSIFSMTYGRYNQSTSYQGNGTLDSDKYYNADADTAAEIFNYKAFNEDHGDLDASDAFVANLTQTMSFTQRLRVTYRNDLVELRLGGRARVNKSWYTMKDSNVAATWNNQIDASMNWTIPGGINLIADVDYNWYEGYTTPQESEVVLNAEITKLLFKNKFTLALKAYDILGQSKNLSVNDSANFHTETRNNTLGRYVILSLTYRFGNFNGNGQHRGPGGHMGPPHRR